MPVTGEGARARLPLGHRQNSWVVHLPSLALSRGHFYLAQIGHSHEAATREVPGLTRRGIHMQNMQIGRSPRRAVSAEDERLLRRSMPPPSFGRMNIVDAALMAGLHPETLRRRLRRGELAGLGFAETCIRSVKRPRPALPKNFRRSWSACPRIEAAARSMGQIAEPELRREPAPRHGRMFP